MPTDFRPCQPLIGDIGFDLRVDFDTIAYREYGDLSPYSRLSGLRLPHLLELKVLLFFRNCLFLAGFSIFIRIYFTFQVFFYLIPVGIVQSLANLNSVRSIGTPVRQIVDV